MGLPGQSAPRDRLLGLSTGSCEADPVPPLALVAAALVRSSIPGGCLTGGEGLAAWLVVTVVFYHMLIWRDLGPGWGWGGKEASALASP